MSSPYARSSENTVLSLLGSSQPSRPSSSTAGLLLFADDVATLVGMTKDWVYAETRAGRIPHVTLGRYYRYRPESIEAWLCEIEHRSTGAARPAARRR
jgi:excisionase family DNA binding protein